MKGKLIAVSFWILLFTGQVFGQGCRVIHSENLGVPSTIWLLPSEVNGTTGTLTVTANGGTASHNLTATLGTCMVFNMASTNGTSAQAYVTKGSYTGPLETWPLNGSNSWCSQSWAMGSVTWHFVVNGLEQDHVTVTTVSGTPGTIISQDDFPTNYYEELKNNFNGTTSMNFEYCPGAATATHTAPFFGTLTNPTTGVSQSFNTSLAFRPNGGYNEEVPPIYVPFLPGDKPPQTSTTGRVECTVAGDFVGLIAATGDNTKNQRVDKKMWTKVKIASTVPASDGGYYVDIWCQEYPPVLPIWAPNEIYSDFAPLNKEYWTAQTCSSSPPGTDPGPGWTCPPINGGPGPGNPKYFFPSMSSVKGSCNTNVNTPAPY